MPHSSLTLEPKHSGTFQQRPARQWLSSAAGTDVSNSFSGVSSPAPLSPLLLPAVKSISNQNGGVFVVAELRVLSRFQLFLAYLTALWYTIKACLRAVIVEAFAAKRWRRNSRGGGWGWRSSSLFAAADCQCADAVAESGGGHKMDWEDAAAGGGNGSGQFAAGSVLSSTAMPMTPFGGTANTNTPDSITDTLGGGGGGGSLMMASMAMGSTTAFGIHTTAHHNQHHHHHHSLLLHRRSCTPLASLQRPTPLNSASSPPPPTPTTTTFASSSASASMMPHCYSDAGGNAPSSLSSSYSSSSSGFVGIMSSAVRTIRSPSAMLANINIHQSSQNGQYYCYDYFRWPVAASDVKRYQSAQGTAKWTIRVGFLIGLIGFVAIHLMLFHRVREPNVHRQGGWLKMLMTPLKRKHGGSTTNGSGGGAAMSVHQRNASDTFSLLMSSLSRSSPVALRFTANSVNKNQMQEDKANIAVSSKRTLLQGDGGNGGREVEMISTSSVLIPLQQHTNAEEEDSNKTLMRQAGEGRRGDDDGDASLGKEKQQQHLLFLSKFVSGDHATTANATEEASSSLSWWLFPSSFSVASIAESLYSHYECRIPPQHLHLHNPANASAAAIATTKTHIGAAFCYDGSFLLLIIFATCMYLFVVTCCSNAPLLPTDGGKTNPQLVVDCATMVEGCSSSLALDSSPHGDASAQEVSRLSLPYPLPLPPPPSRPHVPLIVTDANRHDQHEHRDYQHHNAQHHHHHQPAPTPIAYGSVAVPPPPISAALAGGTFENKSTNTTATGDASAVVSSANFPPNTFCDVCKLVKPLRAKHCHSCGRCVLGMDHHCPWIGACVGPYNRLPFTLLTASMVGVFAKAIKQVVLMMNFFAVVEWLLLFTFFFVLMLVFFVTCTQVVAVVNRTNSHEMARDTLYTRLLAKRRDLRRAAEDLFEALSVNDTDDDEEDDESEGEGSSSGNSSSDCTDDEAEVRYVKDCGQQLTVSGTSQWQSVMGGPRQTRDCSDHQHHESRKIRPDPNDMPCCGADCCADVDSPSCCCCCCGGGEDDRRATAASLSSTDIRNTKTMQRATKNNTALLPFRQRVLRFLGIATQEEKGKRGKIKLNRKSLLYNAVKWLLSVSTALKRFFIDELVWLWRGPSKEDAWLYEYGRRELAECRHIIAEKQRVRFLRT